MKNLLNVNNEKKSVSLHISPWNIKGYRCIYELLLKIPTHEFPFGIASLRIISKDLKPGQIPTSMGNPIISFIKDIESAEKILLCFSPEEREDLIRVLNIQFDPLPYKDEMVFKDAILENSDIYKFSKLQEKIKIIVRNPINFVKLIAEYFSQFKPFIEHVNKYK